MAAIALDGVRKVFAGGYVAIADLNLRVTDGERLALVGPSGSGKSTVLRIIAGLDQPSAGHIRIDERDVTELPPEERDLAMVFQNYALYPHKTVAENLGFGLRMRGTARTEIDRRVAATAESLGIGPLLKRMPAQLSGGQRQRVALGRAIVRNPQAFLLDEPLSNLDPRLRGETRTELIELHRRLGATMVYVTHDQEEAMTLGQRVAVLRDGALEQLAAPIEIYERPSNVFVARFIGSPPMNVLEGRVNGHGTTPLFETTGQSFTLAAGGMPPRPDEIRSVGIRPHDVRLVASRGAALAGQVRVVEPLGHAQIVHVAIDETIRIAVVAEPRVRVVPEENIGISFELSRLHFFDEAGRRM